MPQKPEERLQTVAYVYLRKALPRETSAVWCVEYGQATSATRLFRAMRGVKAGVADMHVLSGGIYIAFELKVRPNRVKEGDNQDLFGQGVHRGGGHWFEVTSCQEIADACKSLGIHLNPLVAVPGSQAGYQLAVKKAKRKAAPMREKAQQDQITKWNASQARIGELFKARGKA